MTINGMTKVIDNPWNYARIHADQSAAVLSDLITRVRNQDEFILMGHSLGARLMANTAKLLGTGSRVRIKEIHLFGAALSAEQDDSYWNDLSKSTSGNIYNYYSENDDVLKYLYYIGSNFENATGRRGFKLQTRQYH